MITARIGSHGTDKKGMVSDFKLLVVREELLVRLQSEIRRQRVEPIFLTIKLLQGLYALPPARKAILVVIGVLPIGQSPLAEIARALCGTRPGFRAACGGKQQARQNGNDGNDHQQFDQGETDF